MTTEKMIRVKGKITNEDNSGRVGVGVDVGLATAVFDLIGTLLSAVKMIVCSKMGIDGVLASDLTEIISL